MHRLFLHWQWFLLQLLAWFFQYLILLNHRQTCLLPMPCHEICYSHEVFSCTPWSALNPLRYSLIILVLSSLLIIQMWRLVLLVLISWLLLLVILCIEMINVGLHRHPRNDLSLSLCLSPLCREVPLYQDALVALPGTGDVRLRQKLINPIICHNDRPRSQLSLLLHGRPLITNILHQLLHVLGRQCDQDGPKEGSLSALAVGSPVWRNVIYKSLHQHCLRPDLVNG